jgi:hypothetical protein
MNFNLKCSDKLQAKFPQGLQGVSDANSSIYHNLFLTTAMGDGAKLWDIRGSKCVQKFSWPGSNSGRIQLGVDICPNFQ